MKHYSTLDLLAFGERELIELVEQLQWHIRANEDKDLDTFTCDVCKVKVMPHYRPGHDDEDLYERLMPADLPF